MPLDLGQTFQQAEDFLRRHIKPKHVQAAEKRLSRHRARHAMRRLGGAASVTGASGAGVVLYGLAVAPLGTAGLVGVGAATLIGAITALSWPRRRASQQKISRAELIALTLEAEAWLLNERTKLPGRALPALDSIFLRLNDLHPHLERLEPNGTIAWDLRRLLTEHLPRLIHSYNGLPGTVTGEDPALLPRLIDGLGTLDRELVRICKEASSDHLLTFETQGRFIETRYGDGIGRDQP